MELNSNSKKFNKLTYSIVALCLMVLLLFTATYAWLSNTLSSEVKSSERYITIDAGAGLEMNYGEEDMNEGTININQVVKEPFALYECTSADGQHIFFPLSEYNTDKSSQNSEGVPITPPDQEFVGTALTNDFIFRPATAKDKNTKYISVDLSLVAKSNTPVWLSNDTKISGNIADAIRIAFIENEPGGKSVVIDNSTQTYGETYSPVFSLVTNESSGKPIGSADRIDDITSHSIGEYTFDNNHGNVLFNLKAGVEKKITVNIWLEGTDAQCTKDIASLSDLDVFIKFSTTREDTKTYYFVDHTLEKWVDHNECNVFAIDETGKKQPMRKSDSYDTDHTWIVELAESKKPVQFARYNPELQENKPQEWNLWESDDPGSCTTYNAYAHNSGIWNDNFTGTTITFNDAMLDHPTSTQTKKAFMYVKYEAIDGNGKTLNVEHKMSHPNNNRWQVVIPSDVSNITFNWYKLQADEETPDFNTRWGCWENTVRGNSTIFNAFENSLGIWDDHLTEINFYDFNDDMCILNQRSTTKVCVEYTIEDENNNTITYNYGMNYQEDHHRWSTFIPSDVSNISFFWGDNENLNSDTSWLYWENTTRGNNTNFFATEYGNSGHWSNRFIYLDSSNAGHAALENGVIYVAYFFNGEGLTGWTSLNSTTANGYHFSPAPEWTNVIICRYNSAAEFNSFMWDDVYNQTNNLTFGTNNLYKITGIDGNDRVTGQWEDNIISID